MDHYDLRHLRSFLAVAETLHFGRAAQRLHVSQPALSRTIRQLEAALAVSLLDRNSRNVALTASGAALLDYGRRLLEQFRACEQTTRLAFEGKSGRVIVGYIDFALGGALPTTLQTYRQANPSVQIELVRMATDMQKAALVASEDIDIGYILGRFAAPDIECALVEKLASVAVFPSQHRLARRPAVHLEEILAEPLVMGSSHDWSAFRRFVFDNALRQGLRLTIAQEAPSSELIFALVAAGVGATISARGNAEISRNGITVRPLRGMKGDLSLYAAWNKKRLSPAARRFVQDVVLARPLRRPAVQAQGSR